MTRHITNLPGSDSGGERNRTALPKPTLSASISGVVTNRVTVAPAKRARKPQPTKGRYHADREVGPVTARCITMPEDLWLEIDAAAQHLMLSRGAFLRRAARLLLDQLAASSDATARGCGARSASCTSR